ncbi:hypothetical protein CLCR_04186 [Cladophialophora carrionii]|uniref:Uncharacterized protein n=1 Tax=Cladophialophora carrionii TaxID=86049 RepID=A0A1C1CIX0_9EURO|nr:hypothetical protein CLCR_04186 [Cladophialophora carrionii]
METSATYLQNALAEESATFLSLPKEARRMIFQLIFPKIQIYCHYEGPYSQFDEQSRRRIEHAERRWYSRGWHFEGALLLVCKQIHLEVKSVIFSAPVTVGGHWKGVFCPSDFPTGWDVSSRVVKVHPGRTFALSRTQSIYGYRFLDPVNCPNLRTVSTNIGRYICKDYNHQIHYPFRLLPTIYQCLRRQFETREHVSTVHLTDLEAICDANALQHARETDRFIKKRNLAFKCITLFEVVCWEDTACEGEPYREWDPRYDQGPDFQHAFSVLVLWDKDGLRVENMPRLDGFFAEHGRRMYSSSNIWKADEWFAKGRTIWWHDRSDGRLSRWFKSQELEGREHLNRKSLALEGMDDSSNTNVLNRS